MQQNAASWFLVNDYFDQLLLDIGDDPRGYQSFRYLENRITRALRGLLSCAVSVASDPLAVPDILKTGTFAIYCNLCPFPLLNEKLRDSGRLRLLRDRGEHDPALGSASGCTLRAAAPIAIARAASELILRLTGFDSVEEVRTSKAYQTAHDFLRATIWDRPTTLPTLLPSIFQFFHLSMWAAFLSGPKPSESVEVKLLPILTAFSRSRVLGVRCLAVAALLDIRPIDEVYEWGRYISSGFDGHHCAGSRERLQRWFKNMTWEGAYESPFEDFWMAWPTNDHIIWEHHKGVETDWRTLALALAENINGETLNRKEEPDDLKNTEPEPEGDSPSLEEIMPSILNALDDTFDPEKATTIRLLASLVEGNCADLFRQVAKAVEDYPGCAYGHCILSLMPHTQALGAAKEGLLLVAEMPNYYHCELGDTHDYPHPLHDYMLRRASVHTWVVMQGPVRSGLLTLVGQDRDRDRDRTDPIFQDRDRTKRLLGPDWDRGPVPVRTGPGPMGSPNRSRTGPDRSQYQNFTAPASIELGHPPKWLEIHKHSTNWAIMPLHDWTLQHYAWVQGVQLFSASGLSNVGSDVQAAAAAFIASVHHDVEEIFYPKLNDGSIEMASYDERGLLFWYILLSIAMFGTEFPEDSTKHILASTNFLADWDPPIEDVWVRFTAFGDCVPCGPQERAPWSAVVDRVDDLIESGQDPGEPVKCDWRELKRSKHLCQRCDSPGALLMRGAYCSWCDEVSESSPEAWLGSLLGESV
ncbi:hypothetical protein OH76DRAFT_1418296 [Lentinus brumalis]|uniref:Uncharacterized protein n=1 Tax=Lentinus brumalis TaxID=2498619 RepID=A0A371DB98_9APHY|nr:hypothetical protein OH76DRAFT_1418296 [Polyporus brumalis]